LTNERPESEIRGVCLNRWFCGLIWLREKDWELTFSEIVSPKSLEGARLGANSLIEFAREFRSGIVATYKAI
jgi:hypothetical protein